MQISLFLLLSLYSALPPFVEVIEAPEEIIRKGLILQLLMDSADKGEATVLNWYNYLAKISHKTADLYKNKNMALEMRKEALWLENAVKFANAEGDRMNGGARVVLQDIHPIRNTAIRAASAVVTIATIDQLTKPVKAVEDSTD